MAKKLTSDEYNRREQWIEKGLHWCTNCKQVLPIVMFGKARDTRFGYNSWCKSCHSNSRKNIQGRKLVKRKPRIS